MIRCFLFLILLSALGCKQKKPPADVMLLVKETGQLVTAEYTLTKIIKASDDRTWYKIGNRKILMQCEAIVKAGVNLLQVNEGDVYVQEDSVHLLLPPAQFFSLHIPPDRIGVQYQEVDILRDPFSAAERENLLAQAEAQIRQTVDSLGILKTAEVNAALYMQQLLKYAGFQKVQVRFKS